MKWEEASKIIKKVWREKIENSSEHYYTPHIKKALKRKRQFTKSVKKFGSPQYILDEMELKKQAVFFIQTFRKYIPNSEFYYAFKSNDLPYLIKSLKSTGFNADVGSLFELQLALKLNFNKIMFTSPGKSIEELRLAIKNKDKAVINIDNEDELEKIKKLTDDKLRVSIRLNSDDKITQRWSKFGIKLHNLKKAVKKLKNLELIGFHFHCSWNETPKRYCKNIELIGSYLKDNFSKQFLSKIEFLDIGGGIFPRHQATLSKFSSKYGLIEVIEENSNKKVDFDPYNFTIDEVDPLEKFAKEISKYLEKYIFSLNKDIKIFFEPGRYINTNSTHVLTKVIAEKENSVIVDAGINLIGGLDFAEYSFAPIINLSNPSFKLKRKIIYGPLCTPNDLWGYSYYGKNIKKGDVLVILHQGSYNFSRAWRFLKETAPYIAIRDNKLVLAKEKEKFEDRYKNCRF